MTLTPDQLDRAIGSIVGMAAGDALGAGYEFGPPLADGTPVHMNGGGGFNWAPGEWTDDTSMAIPILEIVAAGRPFDESALDDIVAAWVNWASTAKDVGVQTRSVFSSMKDTSHRTAIQAAHDIHVQTGRSGGNGSLMRTSPVVLGFLHEGGDARLAAAAQKVSELTHYETDAADACVIWTLAIRHAILTGEVDARVGIQNLPAARQQRWRDLLDAAETKQPRDFEANGWVVEALQAAWSAIHHGDGLVDVLERAVRGGRDTDTVAAIAGALIGAGSGAPAVPSEWSAKIHGWPGYSYDDLVNLATRAVHK